MHILIVSGVGDLQSYIQDQGIGINFIRSDSLDSTHSSVLKNELHLIAKNADSANKGICFTTNRREILEAILNHFSNFPNRFEFIKVNKHNVETYDFYTMLNLLKNNNSKII